MPASLGCAATAATRPPPGEPACAHTLGEALMFSVRHTEPDIVVSQTASGRASACESRWTSPSKVPTRVAVTGPLCEEVLSRCSWFPTAAYRSLDVTRPPDRRGMKTRRSGT
ncbi:MAG: hypothetical protein LC800_21215, partial [Acidobacteria bacterium]|nr:hypothetical protein [Acidobacteriota bacterium]